MVGFVVCLDPVLVHYKAVMIFRMVGPMVDIYADPGYCIVEIIKSLINRAGRKETYYHQILSPEGVLISMCFGCDGCCQVAVSGVLVRRAINASKFDRLASICFPTFGDVRDFMICMICQNVIRCRQVWLETRSLPATFGRGGQH